jgi:phosphate:Na+ symporter
MTNALTVIGGLGVFLFGLRIMSEGLQKLAGNRLRAILSGLTRNRFAGIFSGFTITAAVQSSSATTVLVVSFANAGLLTLAQAIGLVMGANIGTTITAWLVALLGFKVKISAFALPIIGFGFPLSLLNSNRARQLSEVMVGFGLLFLGLKFLKDGVPDLKSNPEALEFLANLSGYGFGSVMIFILVGTVLTVVVQSSSASTAIALAMVAKGWVGFDAAAAMVLGFNIGTTITAQLAAIGATRAAKRVAHFHTLFNVLGVLVILPVFYPILDILHSYIGSGDTDALVLTSRVAAFHTIFNVLVTLMLVPFVNQLERLVLWLVPIRPDEAEGSHLQFLESGLLGTPELATVEGRRGIEEMTKVCDEMFDNLKMVIAHPDQKLGNLVDEIKREEQKTDEMEEEMVAFCAQLARSGTSEKVGLDITLFLDMANDIERIGDHCFNLVLLAERRYEKDYKVRDDAAKEIAEMMDLVDEFITVATEAVGNRSDTSMADAKLLESKINKFRDAARKRHGRRMQDGEVKVRAGLIYLDMMTNMEKIGDYCYGIVKNVEQLSAS